MSPLLPILIAAAAAPVCVDTTAPLASPAQRPAGKRRQNIAAYDPAGAEQQRNRIDLHLPLVQWVSAEGFGAAVIRHLLLAGKQLRCRSA